MTSARAPLRLGRWWLAGLALALLLAAAVAWWPRPQTAAVFDSPDRRFKLVVVRDAFPWSSMPGQAGDNPGWLLLVDRQGRELERTRVAMVQLVEQVEWQPDRVSVRLLADWPLPAAAGASAASAAGRP